VKFGTAGDLPLPANYVGDRRAELSVFRRGTYTTWVVANWTSLLEPAGSDPAPADYTGEGRARPALLNGTHFDVWGIGTIATVPRSANDLVACGNFVGDGRAEPGVFNPTLGLWRILGKSNVVWGIAGDIAV
jgi:hypothetical protein